MKICLCVILLWKRSEKRIISNIQAFIYFIRSGAIEFWSALIRSCWREEKRKPALFALWKKINNLLDRNSQKPKKKHWILLLVLYGHICANASAICQSGLILFEFNGGQMWMHFGILYTPRKENLIIQFDVHFVFEQIKIEFFLCLHFSKWNGRFHVVLQCIRCCVCSTHLFIHTDN